MNFKHLLPHLISVGVLLAVATTFFAPNAFNGKVLPQADNDKARAMQTEIQAYLKKEGKAPLWTNSGFGGMPSYQIYAPIHGNLTTPIYRALLLWSDISTTVWTQVFLAMLCMYLLLGVLKTDWRIALFGATAYGITSYNIDLLEAGHTTKVLALALTPGMLAGLVLTFSNRLMLGGALLAIFTAMQVYANHVQITYYTLLLCGIYFLAQSVDALRHKAGQKWAAAVAVSSLALALGFGSNLSRLWPTYEYGQETIRGRSELQQKAEKGDGLPTSYMFDWSYGVGESLTLLVPHYAGGGAAESFKDTKLYDAVPPEAKSQIRGLFYTGDQPFVGTAIYFGAIVCFLFFLGAWLVPGATKYWLLAGGLFFLSLAWGKNFFLNFQWVDILPMFNKFRAVSMALGISQLCAAALAAVGLQKFVDPDISADKKKMALYVAFGLTAGLCLLALMFGGGAGPNDEGFSKARPDLYSVVLEDRAAMLRSDVFRSLGFVILAAGLLWLYLQNRLQATVMVIVIALASLLDNWMICGRTISSDKYVSKRSAISAPPEAEYDQQIKKDPDPHYRVLDLARGSFTANWVPSYFHKSLTGYHAAKIQRYQEVLDSFFYQGLLDNLHIVGMFNGKYIITQQEKVFANPKACGAAWFVRNVEVLPTADAEFQALHRLNTKDSAVVQQSFASSLQGFQIQPDSTANIRLSKYHPDKMEYEYSAATEQFAVFPEIYYPPAKGWKCYLNGQPAPDFIKVNYLLRGMRLPAGQNMKLEMRFEPRSFYLGETIAMLCSGLVLLLFAVSMYWYFRSNNLGQANLLPEQEAPAPKAKAAAPAPKKKK